MEYIIGIIIGIFFTLFLCYGFLSIIGGKLNIANAPIILIWNFCRTIKEKKLQFFLSLIFFYIILYFFLNIILLKYIIICLIVTAVIYIIKNNWWYFKKKFNK